MPLCKFQIIKNSGNFLKSSCCADCLCFGTFDPNWNLQNDPVPFNGNSLPIIRLISTCLIRLSTWKSTAEFAMFLSQRLVMPKLSSSEDHDKHDTSQNHCFMYSSKINIPKHKGPKLVHTCVGTDLPQHSFKFFVAC